MRDHPTFGRPPSGGLLGRSLRTLSPSSEDVEQREFRNLGIQGFRNSQFIEEAIRTSGYQGVPASRRGYQRVGHQGLYSFYQIPQSLNSSMLHFLTLCSTQLLEDYLCSKTTRKARTDNTMRRPGIVTDLKKAWDRSLVGRS